MLSLPTATPAKMPTPLELRPGLPIEIDHITFSVDDIKDVTYTFAEGELPFAAPQGFKGRSIDLRHGENDFASISFGAGGDVDVFVGHYFEFEDFQFHNLRVIDGW